MAACTCKRMGVEGVRIRSQGGQRNAGGTEGVAEMEPGGEKARTGIRRQGKMDGEQITEQERDGRAGTLGSTRRNSLIVKGSK